MNTVPQSLVSSAKHRGGVIEMKCDCGGRLFRIFMKTEPLHFVLACERCEAPVESLKIPLKEREG